MARAELFTDGAQITTEDKAIVRTGGLVFTSSPTDSITESFHHHPTAFFLSMGKGSLASGGFKLFRQPNGNCGGLKPRNDGTDETNETNCILLTVAHLQMYKINLWLQCRRVQ